MVTTGSSAVADEMREPWSAEAIVNDRECRKRMTELTTDKEVGHEKIALKLPLVSVVIVCYNHAGFIRACLDSIADQTYPHLQLIVVDNASTDASREVIRHFESDLKTTRPDIDFESVFSAENGHEMGAILQGFPRTVGSYVTFVDGDDLLLPGCIETHVKAHLMSRIAAGFSSVDMYQSSGEDVVVGTGPLVSAFATSRRGQMSDFCRPSNLDAFRFPENSAPLVPSDLHYLPPENANEWMWSPSSGLCFRREAAALLLDTRPQIRVGADNYLVRGICALTGGISIDRPLAVYRLHGANLFTKHPALANLNTFDNAQRTQLDLDVMSAVVDCFRANMAALASSLENPDLFIGAIDHFASVAPGLAARQKYSSFSLGFLFANRDAVVAAFGPWLYRKWVMRRFWPQDLIPILTRGRIAAPLAP